LLDLANAWVGVVTSALMLLLALGAVGSNLRKKSKKFLANQQKIRDLIIDLAHTPEVALDQLEKLTRNFSRHLERKKIRPRHLVQLRHEIDDHQERLGRPLSPGAVAISPVMAPGNFPQSAISETDIMTRMPSYDHPTSMGPGTNIMGGSHTGSSPPTMPHNIHDEMRTGLAPGAAARRRRSTKPRTRRNSRRPSGPPRNIHEDFRTSAPGAGITTPGPQDYTVAPGAQTRADDEIEYHVDVFQCPGCGHVIEKRHVTTMGEITCPNCGLSGEV